MSEENKVKKADDNGKFSFGEWFKGIKGEFRKIIWPSRESLKKQTVTVIIVSLLLGGVVFVYDFGLSQGLQVIANLL